MHPTQLSCFSIVEPGTESRPCGQYGKRDGVLEVAIHICNMHGYGISRCEKCCPTVNISVNISVNIQLTFLYSDISLESFTSWGYPPPSPLWPHARSSPPWNSQMESLIGRKKMQDVRTFIRFSFPGFRGAHVG